MPRYAFYDPVTKELKAHGFVETNNPGDVRVDVPDDFNEKPRLVAWDGSKWVPIPPPQAVSRHKMLHDLIDSAVRDVTVSSAVKDVLVEIKRLMP
jgi:hypothetical protein